MQMIRRSKPRTFNNDQHTHAYKSSYRDGEFCFVCDSPRAVCDMPFCFATAFASNLCRAHYAAVQQVAQLSKEKFRSLLPKMRDDIPALTAESFRIMAGKNDTE
jgi:hypothetical protein